MQPEESYRCRFQINEVFVIVIKFEEGLFPQ